MGQIRATAKFAAPGTAAFCELNCGLGEIGEGVSETADIGVAQSLCKGGALALNVVGGHVLPSTNSSFV